MSPGPRVLRHVAPHGVEPCTATLCTVTTGNRAAIGTRRSRRLQRCAHPPTATTSRAAPARPAPPCSSMYPSPVLLVASLTQPAKTSRGGTGHPLSPPRPHPRPTGLLRLSEPSADRMGPVRPPTDAPRPAHPRSCSAPRARHVEPGDRTGSRRALPGGRTAHLGPLSCAPPPPRHGERTTRPARHARAGPGVPAQGSAGK